MFSLPNQPLGRPSRDKDFDVSPGFRQPPPGYGEIAFYWWQGEALDRDRIRWQLDRLADRGITGLQVNYAHSDVGGIAYGLTYPSEPALFSEAWWELFRWFLGEAKARGMSVSLSDFTLGIPGQGWYMDDILAAHPEVHGTTLVHEHSTLAAGATLSLPIPADTLMIGAVQDDDGHAVVVDLRPFIAAGVCWWEAPESAWDIILVRAEAQPLSLDPMHPHIGHYLIAAFFARFEEYLPGEAGAGLNFFFSDELTLGVSGNLWNTRFAAEFIQRKGYDIVPYLLALFRDIGPRTPKYRLDYRDVLVALSEEGYFHPIYAWHEARGMIYGCDHGGRGLDITEFGDYMRTQRWNSAPGNDQPQLAADIIKNKVASSIAHLYERPRTWLEGFYSSGWGTTTAELTDALMRNLVQGHNLVSLHGLYYSTYGGWWEWAPPCNHFRMPYWDDMPTLLRCTERLCYLLSQGTHCCDVAIVYPVATMEAGMDGASAVATAFAAGEWLYTHTIDFDFIDFQSLERATIQDGRLQVAGEEYRVLVLPAMQALRFSTLHIAAAFAGAGGIVIALGALPTASEREGRKDPQLTALVAHLFTDEPSRGFHVQEPHDVETIIRASIIPDIHGVGRDETAAPPCIQHRRIGAREVYLLYGVPGGVRVRLRAHGHVSQWDPWTGERAALDEAESTPEGTIITVPFSVRGALIVVFSATPESSQPPVRQSQPQELLRLPDVWDFTLEPTLDNQWGDFRWPAAAERIGAEVSRYHYTLDTSSEAKGRAAPPAAAQWQIVTATFGPRFWRLGPLGHGEMTEAFEAEVAQRHAITADISEQFASRTISWEPYGYSERWGIEGDPGHQGYHGLKAQVSDEFIALGTLVETMTGSDYRGDPESLHVLWTTVTVPATQTVNVLTGTLIPRRIWIDSHCCTDMPTTLTFTAGTHTILLVYQGPGRTHFVLAREHDASPLMTPLPLAMRWYQQKNLLAFNALPGEAGVGWYRFTAPPGVRALTLTSYGEADVWVDGTPIPLQTRVSADALSQQTYRVPHPPATTSEVVVRILHRPGYYGGAAFAGPMRLTCQEGQLSLGDWSRVDGLRSYSGAAWYRTTFALHAPAAKNQLWLDLGEVVASATILLNGQLVGTLVAPPWRLDITEHVVGGLNHVAVRICNTLANHYTTIPTRYRGALRSGLIGPVTVVQSSP